MEIADFDKAYFSCGMTAKYKGAIYAIATINVEERLLGLIDALSAKDCEDGDIIWVRCENAEVQQ